MGRQRSKHVIRAFGACERTAEWLFYALLVAMPFAFGTVTTRPGFMQAARLLILVIFALLVFDSWRRKCELQVTVLVLIPCGLALFGLFSLLPLPPALLAFLSPETERLSRLALESMGLYGQGQWRPLSLDVAESALGASGYMALTLVFFIAGTLFLSKHRLGRLATVLALTAFGLAVLGFAQKALGLDSIYGLVPVGQETSFLFSSFVNPNHMAAFLGLIVPLQIALMFKSQTRAKKVLWSLLIVISASALLLTLSRAGVLAFLISQLVFSFLLWRLKHAPRRALSLQILAASVLSIALFLALTPLRQEALTLTPETGSALGPKPAIWLDAWNMSQQLPLFGAGLETFKIVSPLYKTQQMDSRVLYPENLELHLATEVGWGLTILILGMMLLWLIHLSRERELALIEIGGLCGLLALALHNQVDFNFTAFSIAVPATSFIAILSLRQAKRHPYGLFRSVVVPPWLLLVLLVLATLTIILGESYWLYARVEQSQMRLYASVHDTAQSAAAFEEESRAEIARHPFDSYLRLLAAEHYNPRQLDERVAKLALLRKAKQLNPTAPLIDRLIGRTYAQGRDWLRARDAYREAMLRPVFFPEVFADMWQAGLRAPLMIAALPPRAGAVADLAEFLLSKGDLDSTAGLLKPWVERAGSEEARLAAILGQVFIRRGQIEQATTLADHLTRRFPEAPQGHTLQADLAQRAGHAEEALIWVEKALACPQMGADTDLLIRKTTILISLKRFPEAQNTALRLHTLAGRNPQRHRQAFVFTGNVAEARGQYHKAAQEYGQALLFSPRDAGLHALIGLMYERLERFPEALTYYEQAAALGNKDPDFLARLKNMQRINQAAKPTPVPLFLPKVSTPR